ncbi:MAG: hypothetical protein LQ347_003894 [Umbilicaria vellea]|nr:MAG: hypothetical protein LQ347_003894 [Umbilicaria vellea]
MSFLTVFAFEYHGIWDVVTRKHSAMAWMESYTTKQFDRKNLATPYHHYHTDDFLFPTLQRHRRPWRRRGWAAAAQLYGPFTAPLHEPSYILVTETEAGWNMIGVANVYFQLPGEPSTEVKVRDGGGKEWDVVVPSSFRFEYVKSATKEGGIVLKSTKIYADTAPVLAQMLKRGLVSRMI